MIKPYLQPQYLIKLTDPRAAPIRVHESDAGADMFSIENTIIMPGEQKLIDTGVAIKIPIGLVGLVYSRSSQGKIGINLANCVAVIDSDYRGNIKVLLKNTSIEIYYITAFDTRIAQLVISPIILPRFITWDETYGAWNDTARGTGGFGSTG